MERVISPEERMRRAEEIYYRRKAQGVRVSTTSVNVGKSNKISLGQKMIIQILVCVVIYTAFWLLKGYNNVFSENIINQTRSILNYDINFQELYNQFMEYFGNNFNSIIKIENDIQDDDNVDNKNEENENQNIEGNDENIEDINKDATNEENLNQENVQGNEGNLDIENLQEIEEGSGEENLQESENNLIEENLNGQETTQSNEGGMNENSQTTGIGGGSDSSTNATNDGTQKAKIDAENKTQMEQDAEYIKQNCNIIHPIKGRITSGFGDREETEIISAFHQGIDISAVTGTAICAAMEGTVIAASYAGDYGNHIKVQNGEVLTVYAHCSELEVKVGDYIMQGQEIGKVGATGKVTGPHLHFEIRRDGRYVDPQLILDF